MPSFFACQVLRSMSAKEYITLHPTLQVEKKTGNMKTDNYYYVAITECMHVLPR